MGTATTQRKRPTGQESARAGSVGRRGTPRRRRGVPLARLLAILARQWAVGDTSLPGFPADNTSPGWLRLVRHHLLPLLAYLLIALAVTYPLVRHLGTYLPGD